MLTLLLQTWPNSTTQVCSISPYETKHPTLVPKRQGFLYGHDISDLVITGGGVIDGQGWRWWPMRVHNQSSEYWHNCRPFLLYINGTSNLVLRDIQLWNGAMFNIAVRHIEGAIFDRVTIRAGCGFATAPNTDGFNINGNNIIITNSTVRNGDDCVPIGVGSKNISVDGLTCECGNGIVPIVWSTPGNISDVSFRNVKCLNTNMCITMKSLPSFHGRISNVLYENIQMEGVKTALSLDVFNQDLEKAQGTDLKTMVVEDVTIRNVTGSKVANPGHFLCNQTCKNIEVSNVQLKLATPGKYDCQNVCGNAKDNSPPLCIKPCAAHQEAETLHKLPCKSVKPADRVGCGLYTSQQCRQRGCCFDEDAGKDVHKCFFQPAKPPADWAAAIDSGHMLFSGTPTIPFNSPNIGNGFIASAIGPTCQGEVGSSATCGPTGPDRMSPSNLADNQNSLGGMFVAGVFNGISNVTVSHRAQLPSVFNVQVKLVDDNVGTIYNLGAALDMQGGMFLNRSVLSMPGCNITVEQRWYAHRTRRYLMVHELLVNTTKASTLSSSACAFGIQHLNSAWSSPDFHFETLRNDSMVVISGDTLLAEVPGVSNTTSIGVAYQPIPSRVEPDSDSLVIRNLLVVHSSLEPLLATISPSQAAETELMALATLPATDRSLEAAHRQGWADLLTHRIEVEGNLTVAAAVNSSLYYIYSSIREDWPYGISPGGLAVNSYDGRSFWDAETWMFPVVDMLNPRLGASLLRYRLDRLPAALAHAKEYGYDGAMYPWTSTLVGVDDTSGSKGYLEQHITGDIVNAVKLHWKSTGNTTMLLQYWPLLEATCKFWSSRAEVTSWSEGNYTVTNVIGPDELSGVVDGDAYTTAIMAATLAFCVEAGTVVGKTAPSEWLKISSRPFLPTSTLLDNLPLNGSAVHLQFHDWPRQGRAIEQSSVALLQYPLGVSMPPRLAEADLMYYENITRTTGFFTGDSIYSIAWLALGNRQAADRQWQAAFQHQAAPFNVWREEPNGGHMNFITGAGGFLQNVINGYAGFRIGEERTFTLRPALPLWGVSRITLRGLHFHSWLIDVSFGDANLSITVRQSLSQKSAMANDVGAPEAVGWALDAAELNHTLYKDEALSLRTQFVQVGLV